MSGFSSNYNSLTPNITWNDIYINKFGNLATTDEIDEIQETAYHSVLLTQGDWAFNDTLGIPWDVYLNSDSPVGSQIRQSVIQAMQGVTGIKQIISFNAVIDNTRTLQITVVAELISGDTINITTPIVL